MKLKNFLGSRFKSFLESNGKTDQKFLYYDSLMYHIPILENIIYFLDLADLTNLRLVDEIIDKLCNHKYLQKKINEIFKISLNLRKFDMNQIDFKKNLLFIGKSDIVVDYLYKIRDIPRIIVFSPSDDCNNKYKSISDILIYDEYNPKRIETFIEQQMIFTKYKRENPSYQSRDIRGAIILDNCVNNSQEFINISYSPNRLSQTQRYDSDWARSQMDRR